MASFDVHKHIDMDKIDFCSLKKDTLLGLGGLKVIFTQIYKNIFWTFKYFPYAIGENKNKHYICI